jgi:membrane protein
VSNGFGSLKELVRQLIHEIREDQVVNGAAALAFFTMLALFPAAIFGLSLLPYLPIPHLRQAVFEVLFEILPPSAAELFTGTVTRIMSDRHGGLLSFGLVFATWSASSGLDAVMSQLNVVYGVTERRSYIRTRGTALLLMLMFFGLLIVTFALVIFGGEVQDMISSLLGWWSVPLRGFFALFRWLVITGSLLAAFAIVYRFAPDVQRPFQLVSIGNLFATAGFLLASFGFRVYVTNFASYDTTYGGLGAAIVLLLWLFIIGAVILIGGELNDLIERGRSRQAQRALTLSLDHSSSLGPLSIVANASPERHRSVYISYQLQDRGAAELAEFDDQGPHKQRALRGLAKSEPAIEHISRAAVLYPRSHELLLHLEVDFRSGVKPKQMESTLRNLARALLQSDPEARRFYIEASVATPAGPSTLAQLAEQSPPQAPPIEFK